MVPLSIPVTQVIVVLIKWWILKDGRFSTGGMIKKGKHMLIYLLSHKLM